MMDEQRRQELNERCIEGALSSQPRIAGHSFSFPVH
jgi:hypothetical protein